jgi:hypothetical protein
VKSALWAKVAYLGFAGAVVLASLLPAWAEPTDDAYPFSTYPMFASKRVTPRFVIAEGRAKSGETARISPEYLGTDEVMQAAATLRKAATEPKRADKLCKQIAARIPTHEALKKVEIVQVRYEPVAYFTNGPEPLERKVIASCPVGKSKRATHKKANDRRAR